MAELALCKSVACFFHSKTNDLCDSKLYRFCLTRAAKINTKWKFLLGALKE